MAEKDIIINLQVNTGDSNQKVEQLAKSEKELAINTTDANQAIKQNTQVTSANAGAVNEAAEANISLKKQLRGLQEELAKLAVAGKQNTTEYKKLRDEAGALKDAISDVSAEVAQAGSDTRGLDQTIRVASAAAAAFSIVEGTAALFGKENEELQKSLLKVTAAMSILNGLQEIQAELTRKDSVFTKGAAAAKLIYAAAVGTSTGAMKLFRIALLATGIGAFIVLIGLLIANFDKIKEAVSKFLPGLNQLQKGFDDTKVVLRGFADAALVALTKVVKTLFIIPRTLFALFNEGLDGAIRVVKETGGELTSLFGDVSNAYQQGANAQKQLNAEAAKTRATQEQIKKLTLEIAKVEATTGDARKLQLQKAKLELSLLKNGTIEYFEKLKEVNDIQKDINETKKKDTKATKELVTELQKLQQTVDKYNKTLENTKDPLSKEGILAAKELRKAEKALDDYLTKIEAAKIIAEDVFKIEPIKTPLFDVDTQGAIDKANADLIESEKQAAEKRKKIQEDYFNFIAALRNQNANSTIKGRVQELKKERDERIKQAKAQKASAEEVAAIEKFYSDQTRNQKLSDAEGILQDIQLVGDAINSVISQSFAFRQQVLDNQLKQGLISEEQYAEKVKELKRKQAIQEKAAAIFNATINGSLAVISAFRQGGIPLAAIIGALVAAQIALIAATPIPKFFKGVIDLKRGVYPAGRDTIPAMLNEGESVMTTAETKRYKTVLTHIRNNTFESKYLPQMAYKVLNIPTINTGRLSGIRLASNSNRSDKDIKEELQLIRLYIKESNRHSKRTADNTNELKKPIKRRFNV